MGASAAAVRTHKRWRSCGGWLRRPPSEKTAGSWHSNGTHGTLVLPAGTTLGPGQLAAAAALGRNQVIATHARS
jgi:hypothetical protein